MVISPIKSCRNDYHTNRVDNSLTEMIIVLTELIISLTVMIFTLADMIISLT